MITSADTYNFKVPSLQKSQQVSTREGGTRAVHPPPPPQQNSHQQHLRGVPPQQQQPQHVPRNSSTIPSATATAGSQSVHSNFAQTHYGGSGIGAGSKNQSGDLPSILVSEQPSLSSFHQSKRASTSMQRKNPRQRAISSGKMHSEQDERGASSNPVNLSSIHDYSRYYDLSRKAMATEEQLENLSYLTQQQQQQQLQQLQQKSYRGNEEISGALQTGGKPRYSQIADTTLTPTNLNYNKNVSFLATDLYESSHSPHSNTFATPYLSNNNHNHHHHDSSSNSKTAGNQSKAAAAGTRELSPQNRDAAAAGARNVFRIVPKNSALVQPNSIFPKISQAFCEVLVPNTISQLSAGNGSNNNSNNFNSISNCSNPEEGAIANYQKSLLMQITNKSRDDETRILQDSQAFAKMDREALVIRLSILEIENKEVKIHNLHLSEKFKELLEEYRRYKEFMDNVDRKSLYQKHVQRLANLSKQLYDSKSTIVERDQCIRDLQEELRVQLKELNRISAIMGDYDALKQAEIDAIEDAHKTLLQEQAARVEELLKLNRKLVNFEFMYNDLMEKFKEENRRFTSIIDKQEDRYRLLMQRWQETEKEIQIIKDKARIHDIEIKKLVEKHNLAIKVKVDEYDERIRKVEMETYTQLLEKAEEIKKLTDKVTFLTEENLKLMNELKTAKQGLIVLEEETRQKQEVQGGETIIIQQQNEQQTAEIEQLSTQIDTMEKSIEQSQRQLNDREKEVDSLSAQLSIFQQRNEELERLRAQMEEAHMEELAKVFAQQNELTLSLNQKIQELKEHYEVEIERMSNECAEKVRLCSQTANDAQRQCQILKVTYNQEIERKDNEIEFLKNKIYQEKQKLKDQVESQYRDVVRDLERRAEYLSNELDTQKWDIENGICEDLAVYNRNSRFWKRSREIRAQKFLTRNDDTDEDDEAPKTTTQQSQRKSNKKHQITPQDRIRIRFQVIATCARAFSEQQKIIDRLQDQFESLTGRRPTGVPARRGSINGKVMTRQQIRALTRSTKKFQKSSSNVGRTEENEHEIEMDTRMDYIDEEMEEMQLLMNERLSQKVSELEEELVNQQSAMIEMQAKFVKSEMEMQENFKIKQKQIQAQLDFASQNKTQAVFQKDIIIEKQVNKIEDMKRVNSELSAQNQTQNTQMSKMRKDIAELDAKHTAAIEGFKSQIEKLQLEINNKDKEQRPQDRKEISRLLELVNEKNEEIKMLKYQANQIMEEKNKKGGSANTSKQPSRRPSIHNK